MSLHVSPYRIDLFPVSVEMVQEEEIPKPKPPEKNTSWQHVAPGCCCAGKKKTRAMVLCFGNDWR